MCKSLKYLNGLGAETMAADWEIFWYATTEERLAFFVYADDNEDDCTAVLLLNCPVPRFDLNNRSKLFKT